LRDGLGLGNTLTSFAESLPNLIQ